MAGRAQISGPSSSDYLISCATPTASSSSSHCLSARAGTAAALGVDPLDAQMRQVFFDTPDLALNRAGVVVRARRRQGEEADTVIKLRPVVPAELPEELRRSKTFNVEVDAMPGGFVCSASFKGSADNGEIREVAGGTRSIRKLFSKGQRAFYSAHAPDGLELDQLSVLGPIPTLKLKIKPKGFGRRLVGELWLYPDGSRSSSCPRRQHHRTRSRSLPRREPSSPASASISRGSSRRRRRRHSSSSRGRVRLIKVTDLRAGPPLQQPCSCPPGGSDGDGAAHGGGGGGAPRDQVADRRVRARGRPTNDP